MLWGVNLSGAEFNPSGTRGVNFDYTYPTHSEIDYYAQKGLDVIRLPFLWERVQPTENGALSSSELSHIDDVVHYVASKGLKVDLDIHDYGSGYGNLVGSAGTPKSAFADLWGKLATHYAHDANVLFGLMNEPNVQNATDWLGSVNAAISAIRSTGATQQILVPGTYWDGAWTWTSSDNDTVIGRGVVDPLHNYAFEVHQYLDTWSSGTSTQVGSATIGVERLTAISQWAEATGNKLFLGEFGAGSDQASLTALGNMLGYMAQHEGAWTGATIWGGGPWWGNYMFSVEPTGLGSATVTDKPQLALLAEYANNESSAAPLQPEAQPAHSVAPPTSNSHAPIEAAAPAAVAQSQTAQDLHGAVPTGGTHQTAVQADPAASSSGPDITPVYRFYDTSTGDHFYTESAAEKAWVQQTIASFKYEGAQWATPDASAGSQDVFRFYDEGTHTHFFTTSADERDFITSQLPQFHYEGVAFEAYSPTGAPDEVTLERFYNTNTGQHHFSANAGETYGINHGAAGPGWVDEGAGFTVHAPSAEMLLL